MTAAEEAPVTRVPVLEEPGHEPGTMSSRAVWI